MKVVLVGHPFVSTGIGEQLRSHVASLQEVGVDVRVLDLSRHVPRDDPELVEWLRPIETEHLGDGVRVFHVGGDDIDATIDRLYGMGETFAAGPNVVVPAWELFHIPAPWVPGLRRFDEVWSLSRMIGDGLERRGVANEYVGQSVQPRPGPMLPRRHFGISESALAFVSFCDFSAHAARKNPDATLAFARRLRELEPDADFQVVMKVKAAERDAEDFVSPLRNAHPDILFISHKLSALETRSLVAAADCLVSLHRAEGFGRVTAEAMYHGRTALATAWSGNLDYMNRDNSLLVEYGLIDILAGQYPHSVAQIWAEPNVENAVLLARIALREPDRVARIATLGRRQVQDRFNNRTIGLRLVERIEALAAARAKPARNARARPSRVAAPGPAKSDAPPRPRRRGHKTS